MQLSLKHLQKYIDCNESAGHPSWYDKMQEISIMEISTHVDGHFDESYPAYQMWKWQDELAITQQGTSFKVTMWNKTTNCQKLTYTTLLHFCEKGLICFKCCYFFSPFRMTNRRACLEFGLECHIIHAFFYIRTLAKNRKCPFFKEKKFSEQFFHSFRYINTLPGHATKKM